MKARYARRIREGIWLAKEYEAAWLADDPEGWLRAMWSVCDLHPIGRTAYYRTKGIL